MRNCICKCVKVRRDAFRPDERFFCWIITLCIREVWLDGAAVSGQLPISSAVKHELSVIHVKLSWSHWLLATAGMMRVRLQSHRDTFPNGISPVCCFTGSVYIWWKCWMPPGAWVKLNSGKTREDDKATTYKVFENCFTWETFVYCFWCTNSIKF